MSTRGLPLGGALEFTLQDARDFGAAWAKANLQRQDSQEPQAVQVARSDYSAAYNVTTGAPVNPLEGVPTPYGRVWAEARSVTHSGGSGAVGVALVSSQNGVRAIVTAPLGTTLSAGSVRFWVFDPVNQLWALGGVEETLATGVRSVATTDQFVTVGAK